MKAELHLVSMLQKKLNLKKINQFDKYDWIDIAGDSGKGFIKGNVRGASIYTLTNFTATPAAVASAMVTASFGVAEQTHLFRKGELSNQQFIQNSELLCLDASVKVHYHHLLVK